MFLSSDPDVLFACIYLISLCRRDGGMLLAPLLSLPPYVSVLSSLRVTGCTSFTALSFASTALSFAPSRVWLPSSHERLLFVFNRKSVRLRCPDCFNRLVVPWAMTWLAALHRASPRRQEWKRTNSSLARSARRPAHCNQCLQRDALRYSSALQERIRERVPQGGTDCCRGRYRRQWHNHDPHHILDSIDTFGFNGRSRSRYSSAKHCRERRFCLVVVVVVGQCADSRSSTVIATTAVLSDRRPPQ